MGAKDIFKKVVRKLGMDGVADNIEINERLKKAQNRLDRAMNEHLKFKQKASEWDDQYNNTRDIKPLPMTHVSNKYNQSKPQQARQVVNITYQLIESQIDSYIPSPLVEAVEAEDVEKRLMVEGMLKYISQGTKLRRINSENERIVKKNGLCVYKIGYNPDIRKHNWHGEIEITNPHPINIVPQPGVHRLQDMDYFFHIENRSISYIVREYGKDEPEKLRDALEKSSAKYTDLENLGTLERDNLNSELRSVVEMWYRDEDGDVCKYTWCDEIELEHIPKFYYKRDAEGNLIEVEEIEIEDEETGEMITVQVPAYIPKRYPFVTQYNVPKEKSFFGKADPEIISDQQEGIKKILSMNEEKQILGTTKVITRMGSGLKDKLTNATLQVLETEDPVGDVKVVDMKTNDGQLMETYQIYVQAAKDALGVTEASQGRAEFSNLSGKAIELLAQHSAGRMNVKKEEKNIAFTELYQLIFDFLMAYYDEPRPYRIEGLGDSPEFGYFDKSKLLKRDITGEYYWPEFDIRITTELGLPKTKEFVLTTATEAIQYGALDPLGYWTILQSIGFPNADAILRMIQEQMVSPEEQADMFVAEILQTLANMNPEARDAFLQTPVENQLAMLQQVIMGGEQDGQER